MAFVMEVVEATVKVSNGGCSNSIVVLEVAIRSLCGIRRDGGGAG